MKRFFQEDDTSSFLLQGVTGPIGPPGPQGLIGLPGEKGVSFILALYISKHICGKANATLKSSFTGM